MRDSGLAPDHECDGERPCSKCAAVVDAYLEDLASPIPSARMLVHYTECSDDMDYPYDFLAGIATAAGAALSGSREACAEFRAGLMNLLAVIHRDGGHHTDAVGLEQSLKDAHERVVAWISRDNREFDRCVGHPRASVLRVGCERPETEQPRGQIISGEFEAR